MTDDQTPPSAPRPGPPWAAPSGPPAGAVPQGPFVLAPAAPKKRHPVLTHGAAALVALFVGVGIGASGGGGDDGKPAADASSTTATSTAPATTAPPKGTTAPPPATTTAAPRPTTTKPKPKPKPTRKPGPPTSFDGDGEYLVGEDIAAGTYKTAGSADDFGCYWERDKDSSGEFSSIIANDNLNGSGRVTVRKGEIFKTERCQTWKKVG